MAYPPHNSIREGEHLGTPTRPASAPSSPAEGQGGHAHNDDRKRPDYVISKRIGIPGVIEAEVGITKQQIMSACKGMYEHWKQTHPEATHTPIRYSQCSKEPAAPVVEDHRPPAPKGQQH